MSRRSPRGSLGIGLAIVVLIILAFQWASQYWQEILALVVAIGIIRLAVKSSTSKPATDQAPDPVSTTSTSQRTSSDSSARRSVSLNLVRTDLKQDPRHYWVDATGNATVHGRFAGGMIYVGEDLAALSGYNVEPALINPKLPAITQTMDLSQRRTSYWSSYSGSSAEARGAYLQWLSTGRKDPNADIGLVFLYFYGLERRVLADTLSVSVSATEIEAIKAEVQRLLEIYTNNSFRHYAINFLGALEAKNLPSGLYRSPPPSGPGLLLRHKVGLAQCAQDGAPLRTDWAIAWLEGDTSNGWLPTAARRCQSEFRRLFAIRYAQTYGEGLILPKNKTKLRFDYHAASASFHGWRHSLGIEFDLPDVTVLTSPLKKLRVIAENCCVELSGYSRRMAKPGVDPDSLECIAELPYSLWPDKYRGPVEKIRAMVAASGQPLAVPLESVLKWMPTHTTINKALWRAFVARLGEASIGVEPDPAAGGPAPKGDTRVAFFPLVAQERTDETSARYRAAAMTLQLAVAVASADGEAQDVDRSALIGRLENWLQLTVSEKARLNAHLRRILAEPPKITGFRPQIEAMNKSAREAVGTFVVSVAQTDGLITKAEHKTLERIYKLLDLDTARLPRVTREEPQTVVAAGKTSGAHPIRPPAPVFELDKNRVRQLQAETERVAALLTGIFNEEETEAPTSSVKQETPEHEAHAPGLWSLDAVHSDLASTLLGRAHWTRVELEELAEDRQIMLDGALETINEACLDATGQSLLDGNDPVEVNREMVREKQAV